MQLSIYERITQQIVDAVEQGADEYVLPWHRDDGLIETPANAVTGRAYRGLNILTLWAAGMNANHATGRWATYRQWIELGAQVRKGEQGASIFFWESKAARGSADEDGLSERRRPAFVAKTFTVFNADQVDGFVPPIDHRLSEPDRIQHAELFFAKIDARIEHGGNMACYRPGLDQICMPSFSQFRRPEAYYSVLAHELVHWSGAKHRLDRELSGRFGSSDYAMEELVAELGAAFLCARIGIGNEPRRDHAHYIASWLKVLKQDARAVFTAATSAQAAADHLWALAKSV